jgi:hypothetical protein
MMRTKEGHPMLKKAALIAAAAIGGAFLAAAPALASNAGTTMRISVPLADAGLTLTCGTTVLTGTGGTASLVSHQSTDARGIFHVTGTGTVTQGTLQDTAGNTYSISGATWFGGSTTNPDANEAIVFTSTDKLVIRTATGGVFGKVNFIEHISPDGTHFAFDFGTCSD